jgi:hypothetical protein
MSTYPYPDTSRMPNGRPIPTLPAMPTKEKPWAKKRRAQLMTRMEAPFKPVPFGMMGYSMMSPQRAAAIASRDLGTSYEEELPNFTSETGADLAAQRMAPKFLQSQLETEESQRNLPWEQLSQQKEQFGTTSGLATRELDLRNAALRQQGELGFGALDLEREKAGQQYQLGRDTLAQQGEIERGKLTLQQAATGALTQSQLFSEGRAFMEKAAEMSTVNPQVGTELAKIGQQMLDMAQRQTQEIPSVGTRPSWAGQPSRGLAGAIEQTGGQFMDLFTAKKSFEDADIVLKKYGLDKYLDPSVSMGLDLANTIGKRNFNIQDIQILKRFSGNLKKALKFIQDNPQVMDVLRSRLSESVGPVMDQILNPSAARWWNNTMFPVGNAWTPLAGKRFREAKTIANEIKSLLEDDEIKSLLE